MNIMKASRASGSVLVIVLGTIGCGIFNPSDGHPNCPDTDYPNWETSLYVLPYQVGETYEVLQGNCTGGSHSGDIRFGFDFTMPIGTTITAARSGIVEEVVEHHPNYNGRGMGANIVVLRHIDGTRTRYGHLDQNGVFVDVSGVVQQGDVLGRSGASNLGPDDTEHLHFHVQEEVGRQTLPSTFRNTAPNPDGLIVRTSYTAEPFTPEDR